MNLSLIYKAWLVQFVMVTCGYFLNNWFF